MSDNFELMGMNDPIKHASHDSSVGVSSRNRSPGLGWCLRCGVTWGPGYSSHAVTFKTCMHRAGMSPTCECCWKISLPVEKMLYCKALFRAWQVGHLRCAWSANIQGFDDDPEWLKILEALQKEIDEEKQCRDDDTTHHLDLGDKVKIGGQEGIIHSYGCPAYIPKGEPQIAICLTPLSE